MQTPLHFHNSFYLNFLKLSEYKIRIPSTGGFFYEIDDDLANLYLVIFPLMVEGVTLNFEIPTYVFMTNKLVSKILQPSTVQLVV